MVTAACRSVDASTFKSGKVVSGSSTNENVCHQSNLKYAKKIMHLKTLMKITLTYHLQSVVNSNITIWRKCQCAIVNQLNLVSECSRDSEYGAFKDK